MTEKCRTDVYSVLRVFQQTEQTRHSSLRRGPQLSQRKRGIASFLDVRALQSLDERRHVLRVALSLRVSRNRQGEAPHDPLLPFYFTTARFRGSCYRAANWMDGYRWRSAGPDLHAQAAYSQELPLVHRRQNAVMGAGDGGDQQIVGSDGRPCAFQAGPNQAVLFCRPIVERETLERTRETSQHRQVGVNPKALSGSPIEFRENNTAQNDFPRGSLAKASRQRLDPFQQTDADVGVQKIHEWKPQSLQFVPVLKLSLRRSLQLPLPAADDVLEEIRRPVRCSLTAYKVSQVLRQREPLASGTLTQESCHRLGDVEVELGHKLSIASILGYLSVQGPAAPRSSASAPSA